MRVLFCLKYHHCFFEFVRKNANSNKYLLNKRCCCGKKWLSSMGAVFPKHPSQNHN